MILAERLTFQIYNHQKGVTSVDIQNEVVASGSLDNKVQAWNMTSGKKLIEVAHENDVFCIKLVHERLLSCGDKTVRVWSLQDGSELHKFQHSSWCNNFDLNFDETLLAVAHSGGLTIWDFSNRIKLQEIEINDVYDVRFNESGMKLVFGLHDGTVFYTEVKNYNNSLKFAEVLKMSHNIWALPRETFCWLNETKAIVVSTNNAMTEGNCSILDTVS